MNTLSNVYRESVFHLDCPSKSIVNLPVSELLSFFVKTTSMASVDYRVSPNDPWQTMNSNTPSPYLSGKDGVQIRSDAAGRCAITLLRLSSTQDGDGGEVFPLSREDNAKQKGFLGNAGVTLMEPGSGVRPVVAGAGTGWTVTSQEFVEVDGESWFRVVMTGTGAGIGQLDLTLSGLRPFAADSLAVEYMADHGQGGPMTANISVDTNFSGAGSPNIVSNGRNMATPNSGDPLMQSGRNSVVWCRSGMSVVSASFVISVAEPVIGKLWTAVRIRRAINNITGTVTFWLRSIRAGVNSRKGRLAIVADDGYHSWFRLGVPILARYGLVSSAAIIASGVDTNTGPANGNATLAELKAYVRAGNFIIGHGPNAADGPASLFAGSLAGGVERTADRVADMLVTKNYILNNGLATEQGASCYVWPQGTYNTGNGGVELLDAAYAAGFRLCRSANAYPLLLQKVNAISPRSHSRMLVPIIGHNYAGTIANADNAAETANIAAIVATIQNAADSGVDCVLMLHRVVARGATTSGPGGIEIETDRLASLCASIQTMVNAGTLECVGFEQLA